MAQISPCRREADQSGPADAAGSFACGFNSTGGGASWVSVRGDLDLAGVPQFTRTVEQASERALLVIIDLRQLTFIDATGISAILEADTDARRTGRRLVLIRGPEPVGRLFALLGLDSRLKIVDLTPDRPLRKHFVSAPVQGRRDAPPAA